MALPPAGSYLRIRFLWSSAGSTASGFRSFWSYTGGPPTAANLTTLAGDCQTAWNTNCTPMIPSTLQLVAVDIDDLSSSTALSGSWSGSTPGSRSGGPLPLSTAALMDLAIARKYRGGKPKMFLPFGVDSDLTASNQWSSTFITACHTAWAAMTTAITGASGVGITVTGQVNISYYHGSQANTNPSKWAKKNVPALRTTPLIDAITNYQVRQVPGVQRRRRGS